jgi:hypothetical protein
MALSVQEILDTNIPQPSFSWRPSRAAPYPSDVNFSRSNEGYTFDPVKSKYVLKGADVPRIWGAQGGLMITGSRTNQVEHSRPDQGKYASTSISGTLVNSVFENKQAVEASASSGSARYSDYAGVLSSDENWASVIAEKGTSGSFDWGLRDNGPPATYEFRYDWGSDSVTTVNDPNISGTIQDTYIEHIPATPNGGKMVRVWAHVSGMNNNEAEVTVWPDTVNGSGTTIFHHQQFVAGYRIGSNPPIWTTGSAKTEGGDNINIPDASWRPETENGAVLFDFTLYRGKMFFGEFISNNSNGDRIEYRSGASPGVTLIDNSSPELVTGSHAEGTRGRILFSTDGSEQVVALNGDVNFNQNYDGDLFAGGNSFSINRSGDLVGQLHGFDVFPGHISPTDAQALTAI